MTDKQIRHERMQNFKNEIALVSNRNLKIKELTANVSNLTELERLKIITLLQKRDFINGCEVAFKELITQIKLHGDNVLKEKALAFANKNNIKL